MKRNNDFVKRSPSSLTVSRLNVRQPSVSATKSSVDVNYAGIRVVSSILYLSLSLSLYASVCISLSLGVYLLHRYIALC